jgi:hypothetical protein
VAASQIALVALFRSDRFVLPANLYNRSNDTPNKDEMMRIKILLLVAVIAMPTQARDNEKFAAYQQRLKDRRTTALQIRRQRTLFRRYGPPISSCHPSRDGLYDIAYPSPRTLRVPTKYRKPDRDDSEFNTTLTRF